MLWVAGVAGDLPERVLLCTALAGAIASSAAHPFVLGLPPTPHLSLGGVSPASSGQATSHTKSGSSDIARCRIGSDPSGVGQSGKTVPAEALEQLSVCHIYC